KRHGDANYLRALGGEWGFTLDVVGPVTRDGEIVSSTRIRRLLAAGQVEAANRLLGHRFALTACLPNDLSVRVDVKRQLPRDGSYECAVTNPVVSGTNGGQQTVPCDAHIAGDTIRLAGDEIQLRALSGAAVTVEFVRERTSPSGDYEEIGHTADVALRVRASSLAELLRHAARGMFALMADTSAVQANSEQTIEVSGADNETLLVNWLSELLFLSETTHHVFTDFDVQLVAPDRVRGIARGGPAGEIRKQIKAVTFHDLRIEQRDGMYETTIVFDI
ncbi:MAG: archease, partial [Chloroflexota bacterium]